MKSIKTWAHSLLVIGLAGAVSGCGAEPIETTEVQGGAAIELPSPGEGGTEQDNPDTEMRSTADAVSVEAEDSATQTGEDVGQSADGENVENDGTSEGETEDTSGPEEDSGTPVEIPRTGSGMPLDSGRSTATRDANRDPTQ